MYLYHTYHPNCAVDTPLASEYNTRIITLMPYFLVRNLTTKRLRFMEENDKMDLWNDLEPQQVSCRRRSLL